MGNNSVPKFIFRLSRFQVYRGSVLGRFYCILKSLCYDVRSEKHQIMDWTVISSLHTLQCHCRAVPCRAIFRPVSHWPLTAEAQVRYWTSPWHMVDKVALGLFFLFQLLPTSQVTTIPPILHTHLHLYQDNRSKFGNVHGTHRYFGHSGAFDRQ